jgi:hypothetical protein
MDLNFENKFFLQILGDHARFIHKSLSPTEEELIEDTIYARDAADELLERARGNRSINNIDDFLGSINDLKTEVASRLLTGEIDINMDATFVNHMRNELDEYRKILDGVEPVNTIPVHKLWLLDAAGHSDALICRLDPTEELRRKRLKKLKKHFDKLFHQTLEFEGFQRFVDEWPAISALDEKSETHIRLFINDLEELFEGRQAKTILGIFPILMPDHMIREENYYLFNISRFNGAPDMGAAARAIAPRRES